LKIPKILQVLYSPSKVFEELAEKPSYKGVILILILFIASNILAVYTVYSKQYVQRTKPDFFENENDIWTENATLWSSANGECIESDDKVYGEHSIACTITNKSELSMQITLPETINCSTHEFNLTSFSLKLNCTENPINVSLVLSSENKAEFFTLDLTEKIKEIGKWNNITVPLGEGATESSDWHRVNGVKITVKFPENVNATLLLDALFFRGQYEPLLNYFTVIAGQYSMLYFMSFVLLWIIFGGLLYILSKYAGSELAWKHDLIISGYSLAPLFVQGIFFAILFSFLPRINIPLGTVTDTVESGTLIFNLASYSQFLFLAWGIIISTFAVRTLNNFTTGKSAAISSTAYLIAFLLARFLGF